jgi:serine/threonine protein kinase
LRARFDREARMISQLDHPHICALYDVGDQNGTAFLVMQYLEGDTLEARLKGALPLDQALFASPATSPRGWSPCCPTEAVGSE